MCRWKEYSVTTVTTAHCLDSTSVFAIHGGEKIRCPHCHNSQMSGHILQCLKNVEVKVLTGYNSSSLDGTAVLRNMEVMVSMCYQSQQLNLWTAHQCSKDAEVKCLRYFTTIITVEHLDACQCSKKCGVARIKVLPQLQRAQYSVLKSYWP
jgi:hypothetical protein